MYDYIYRERERCITYVHNDIYIYIYTHICIVVCVYECMTQSLRGRFYVHVLFVCLLTRRVFPSSS